MRNSLTILVAGFLLGGCLSAEDSISSVENAPEKFRAVNATPTIGGIPPTAVLHGESYDFVPVASDPDGDALQFVISNKPVWAQFDVTTGRLFGVPTFGHIGTYENVVISVSDLEKSESLRAFSIVVSQSALGAVTLSWLPPTENTDGSQLTDLARYKIRYGKSSRTYDREIVVSEPGVTTYVVENLLPDTYYFAATSINSAGVESEYSSEAVRTVE